MAGDRISLWAFLHKIPPFDSMRVSQRFNMIFIIFIALLAGLGSQRLHERLKGGAFYFLIIGISLFSLWFQDYRLFRDNFKLLPPALAGDGVFQQKKGDEYARFVEGDGDAECELEPLKVSKKAVPASVYRYKGEVHLEGVNGKVWTDDWTPNRLRFTYDIVRETAGFGHLVVNQNHDPGWKTRGGQPVENIRGLLAVKLIPGRGEVDLYYMPNSLKHGAALSILGIVCAAVFLAVASRRRKGPAPGGG
jgi:uncharacterized membrane protein YfhO